jgi:hypothetical protein
MAQNHPAEIVRHAAGRFRRGIQIRCRRREFAARCLRNSVDGIGALRSGFADR